MRCFGIILAGIGTVALVAAANAQPVKLSQQQMATITAGAITTTVTTSQLNGGGNTPSGVANGVPIVTTSISTNPAGSPPPGHNK